MTTGDRAGNAGLPEQRMSVIADMPAPVAPPRGRRMGARAAREIAAFVEVVALVSTLAVASLTIDRWHASTLPTLVMFSLFWVWLYVLLTYRFNQAPDSLLARDLLADRMGNWLKSALLVVILAFTTKTSEDLSRLWFGASAGLGLAAIGVSRTISWAILSSNRFGSARTHIAIYGAGENIDELRARLDSNPLGVIDGLYDDGAHRPRRTAGLAQLLDRARGGQIDAVVINLPWSDEDQIKRIVAQLEAVNVDMLLVPPEALAEHGAFRSARLGQLNALALYTRPADGIAALIKTCMDRLFALIALIALSPLMLAVALAIRLESPGPIFFRQQRCGLNNTPFTMWKFRSMRQSFEDRNADRLVTRGDSRVTKVGALIRKLSIDELPQFLNVLNGTMSLVGPRPHAYGAKAADRLYEEVVDRYAARHRMRPGLTGLAQVRGFRGNTENESDIRNRVAADLEYMDRWSLSLDLAILFRTAIILFWQRNAY
ncbi:MAG TPA: exopolysaccharide biosynthesis polyprenyl glycosylphosphotransferase [Sphingobium sp.]